MRVISVKEAHSEEIKITTEFIKLESFLKLCGASFTGGEAKNRIQNGEVQVDGEVCTMRGKKLYPGARVTIDESTYLVKG